MNELVAQIRSAVNGRHPLLYLHSAEEERVATAVSRLIAEENEVSTKKIFYWDCVNGLATAPADTADPVIAIQWIINQGPPGFYLMNDLPEFADQPQVVRALRNAYHQLKSTSDRTLLLISPQQLIPPGLEQEICLLEVASPSEAELETALKAVQQDYPERSLPEGSYAEVILALRGLTLNEVGHVLHRVFHAQKTDRNDVLQEIFNEKARIIRKSGFLEFIPPRCDISQIGGLDNLKNWLLKRQGIFNRDSVAAGLPLPRGILLMGVSGCGKSLCAKAVSALWGVPLFRLDMNLVFSGLYGSPEAAFHTALKIIEGVAPAVLWIDEIENGLGISETNDPKQQHIFSAFLTWLQEKPPLIFVAATANQIHLLPAEIIRKGRFDQVFFCDLPNEEDRRNILEIHLRRNQGDPADFDLNYLVVATEGWNGAEIEQAVIAARIDAAHEQRPFTTADISRHTRTMVPISETMAEQIKAIRSWAWGRATTASKSKKPQQR